MKEYLQKLHPALYTLVAVAAFLLGMLAMYVMPHHEEGSEELRDSGNYKYVSPLLACGEVSDVLPETVGDMRDAVEKVIAREKAAGSVSEVGVYFRDLRNGPWFGVNDDAVFTPGSLLKVPMMMAYYKRLSTDPSLAEQKLTFKAPVDYAHQNIHVANPLIPGQEYAASQIVEHMITQSDNDAAALLYELIGGLETNRVYTELGLAAPLAGRDYDVTVQFYATFFRILYNATYLPPESSERALELLTRVEFKDGLVAGVPTSVPVAHKFGERKYESSTLTQLHDCGIVYAPNQPYTLCVMTRGENLERQADVIADISREVYSRFTK